MSEQTTKQEALDALDQVYSDINNGDTVDVCDLLEKIEMGSEYIYNSMTIPEGWEFRRINKDTVGIMSPDRETEVSINCLHQRRPAALLLFSLVESILTDSDDGIERK